MKAGSLGLWLALSALPSLAFASGGERAAAAETRDAPRADYTIAPFWRAARAGGLEALAR